MTIVGGHQRIEAMDSLLRKDDYELSVAMIDVDEKDEVSLNVFLNNQSAMGEWDVFALQDIKNIFQDIDFETDMGFDESEIDVLLGEPPEIEETPIINPMKEAKKQGAEDYRQLKKEQREKQKNKINEFPEEVHELSDLDYTLTIVFPNNREKYEFMRKIRKDPKEKYLKSSILLDIYNHVYDISVLGGR